MKWSLRSCVPAAILCKKKQNTNNTNSTSREHRNCSDKKVVETFCFTPECQIQHTAPPVPLGPDQIWEQLQEPSAQLPACRGARRWRSARGRERGNGLCHVPEHTAFTAGLTRNSCVKYLEGSINYWGTAILLFVTFSWQKEKKKKKKLGNSYHFVLGQKFTFCKNKHFKSL